MKRRLFKTFVALLAIAAAAAGPVRGQTTYNVTFSGFNYPELNTTVNVASLPQTFTSNFNPPSVVRDECYGFTNAYVTSGGEGEVSASVVTFTEMSITVSGTFEGTATIHVTGKDDEERDISTDVYVSCVAVAPAAPTPHTVTFAEGTEDVGHWSFTPAEAATNTGVTAGTVVTVKYNGTSRIESIELKSKMLATPLTMEALTAGTIMVQNPQSGMQYSKNGGAKTAVTSDAITVAAGDKVAFYGDSTNITSYSGTKIGGSGDGFTCKVYGNIMSLVNEEHFDTATTLTANNAFNGLFKNNVNLSDASGLLLPATTLTANCYVYMFQGCTSLTTAPALPAPVLAPLCYYKMFQLCTKLNSVTCLATDISATGCIRSWLDLAGDAVQGTKTFNAVSTAEWPTNSVDGIPSGWTRQDIGAQSTPEPVTLVPTGNTNEWTFTMPADNMLLMLNYAPAHTVRFADGNNGWSVQDVTAATSAVAPAVLQNVIAGDSLVVTAPTTLPGKVKSVKAVKYVPPVLVQSIVLDKQTAFLAKDSTMTLSVASVLPENAADKSYTWSSDNTPIATVNATTGVVTGMAAGTANIIATANDGSGVKDTCVVTVLSSAILDGVRVLYASDYGLETWSTVVGYNPGVMYQDGDYVKLTSNGAFLCHDGHPVYADDYSYPPFNDYQWLLVANISGSDFYYRQGETWEQAISADRLDNNMWSIEGGQVKFIDLTLVDINREPVAPTATIDPSTVYYELYFFDN